MTPTTTQAVAPANSLPNWAVCWKLVRNENELPTELHRFIYEYDDADAYRSGWFLHRLELVLAEHAATTLSALQAERDALLGRLGELSRELLLTWNLPHHVKQSAVDRIAQELGRMAIATSSAAQGEGDGRG